MFISSFSFTPLLLVLTYSYAAEFLIYPVQALQGYVVDLCKAWVKA